MSALLEVRDLQVAYGHIEAVQGISFDVNAGEIRTLVGANGAGKSTTLLALSGLVKPRSGSIRFAWLSAASRGAPVSWASETRALCRRVNRSANALLAIASAWV